MLQNQTFYISELLIYNVTLAKQIELFQVLEVRFQQVSLLCFASQAL